MREISLEEITGNVSGIIAGDVDGGTFLHGQTTWTSEFVAEFNKTHNTDHHTFAEVFNSGAEGNAAAYNHVCLIWSVCL